MPWTKEELRDREQSKGDAEVLCFGWQYGRTRGMDATSGTCPRHGCALLFTTADLMTAQLRCPKRRLAGKYVQENKQP